LDRVKKENAISAKNTEDKTALARKKEVSMRLAAKKSGRADKRARGGEFQVRVFISPV
jgi:hypothetical protein